MVLSFFFLFISSLEASDAKKPPQVITIKAKKISTAPLLAPGYAFFSVPQLNALQYNQVKDVLQQEPGFYVVQWGSPGQPASVFVRGMNTDHLQVRIDGMKATSADSPNGSYDFADFTTDGLQSVELIRGAASSLYGADAVSGVVQVRLAKGEPGFHSEGYAEVGSNPSEKLRASVSAQEKSLNFSLSAGVFHTSGRTITPDYLKQSNGSYPNLPYTLKNYVLRVGKAISEGTEVILFSRYSEASLFYQANVRSLPQDRTQALNRLEINHDFSQSWSHQIGMGILHTSSENAKNTDAHFKGNGQRLALNWIQKIKLNEFHFLQTVIEGEREDFRTYNHQFLSKANRQTVGIGGVYRWKPMADFVLEASLRKDLSQGFTSPFCYRVGSSYKLPSVSTEVTGSIATAFKAPTLYELYGRGQYFKGNPSLKPERIKSYEVGIKQPFSQLVTVTMIYFENQLTQLLIYDFTSEKMQNITAAETKGVESTVTLTTSYNIKVEANHTLLFTKNKKTNTSLVRRPRHKAFLRVGYGKEKLEVFLEGLYVGKRQDYHPLDYKIISNKPYKTVAIKLDYKWTPTLTSFFRVENLLNKKIEEPLGYQQPGITGHVGLQAKF